MKNVLTPMRNIDTFPNHASKRIRRPPVTVIDVGIFPLLSLPTDLIKLIAHDPATTAKMRLISKEVKRRIEEHWQIFKEETFLTRAELYRYIIDNLYGEKRHVRLYYLKMGAEETRSDDKHIYMSMTETGVLTVSSKMKCWVDRNYPKTNNVKLMLYRWCRKHGFTRPKLSDTLCIFQNRCISRYCASRLALKELTAVCIQYGWKSPMDLALRDQGEANETLYENLESDALECHLASRLSSTSCHVLTHKERLDPDVLRHRLDGPYSYQPYFTHYVRACYIYSIKGYIPRVIIMTYTGIKRTWYVNDDEMRIEPYYPEDRDSA